jgi:hypothetical protein
MFIGEILANMTQVSDVAPGPLVLYPILIQVFLLFGKMGTRICKTKNRISIVQEINRTTAIFKMLDISSHFLYMIKH